MSLSSVTRSHFEAKVNQDLCDGYRQFLTTSAGVSIQRLPGYIHQGMLLW